MSERPCAVESCGRPVGDAYVCQACALDLERALGDVRWLLDQLDIVLTKQTASAGGVGWTTGSKDAPLPYNVEASEARWVLVNTVTTWARVVEEEHPNTTAAPTIGGVGLLAAWLSSYAGWLRTHSAAGEVVEEVLSAVASAQRIVDVKPDRWYAGPCEGADGQVCGHDLYAKPNAARVTCPACGTTYDAVERREWLLEAARDHLGTAREVVGLFRGAVTSDQLKGWVRRGKVSPHGSAVHRGRSVATYRIGDVMDVCAAERFDEREQRATKRAGRLG